MLNRLYRQSIWHPDSLGEDEFKYRNLKRVWLPLYDLLAIVAGLWATIFGSPLLHRIIGDNGVVTALGLVLTFLAVVCLIGVSFPRLYRVELVGKVALTALIGTYAIVVGAFRLNPEPEALFVSFILLLTLPLPMFRLNLLGEEIKERRSS